MLFADDTNVFFCGKPLSELESHINDELCNISGWLKANKLSLNISKTHYIVFNRKKNIDRKLKIHIDNQDIEEVLSTKFQGVINDSKLTWKQHISYILDKIVRNTGMIIKAKYYLNKNALLTLYYSFVYPYFTHCNHVWGCTYSTNLDNLYQLQKKLIRIISNIRKRKSISHMFDELGITEFVKINLYLTCHFMFRWYDRNVPVMFHDFFAANSDVHGYYTRQSDYLHAPQVKSYLNKFGIRYRGVIMWNALLKLGINPDTSKAVFSKTIETCIKNKLLHI